MKRSPKPQQRNARLLAQLLLACGLANCGQGPDKPKPNSPQAQPSSSEQVETRVVPGRIAHDQACAPLEFTSGWLT